MKNMATMHDLRISLREKMKQISELELQIKELQELLAKKEAQTSEFEAKLKKKEEVISMKDYIIKEKDNYIKKLEDSLRSSNDISEDNVNHITVPSTDSRGRSTTPQPPNATGVVTEVATIVIGPTVNPVEPGHGVHALNSRAKRFAISAEPAQVYKKSKDLTIQLKEFEKPHETKEFLRNGILDNDFMKNLEVDQINAIVDCMYPMEYAKDSLIIVEGDVGNLVYIIDEGTVEVIKGNKHICQMGNGKLFGELAILYNCTRTASIKALTHCKLWAIDRITFQTIMMRFGLERQADCMELLKNVPTFQAFREDILAKFIDIFDEHQYNNGEYIVRQYAKGNTFYIISKGQVKITKSASKWDEAQVIKILKRGEFFGEDALQKEETRGFNVIADDPNGVTCLALERSAYNELILTDPAVSEFKREESIRQYRRAKTQVIQTEEQELNMVNIRLSEFEIITTLGVGGFGRVELVRNTRDNKPYAMKIIKKQYVVETNQQRHVMSERNVMYEIKNKHINRLYKTFKDKKYLYMVLEFCIGGELFSLLREKTFFEENDVKFYIAGITEALQYLHSKGIIYRDLKPENILLDHKGYCKLVDFGFAKKIGSGKKTWTFCGTPEYVAPEIILNKGHDCAADYWSLGILIFELLSGNPPFVAQDAMKTYNTILKGIDAVEFPRQIPKTAGLLIKKLCRENPVERLGYQRGGIKDIQKHKWFEGFSWENFRSGTLKAPYVPVVKHDLDTSNFDKYPEDTSPEPADDVTGWEVGF